MRISDWSSDGCSSDRVKWRNDNITAKYSFTHMDRYMPEIVPDKGSGLQGYSLIDLPEYTFPQVNLTEGPLAGLGVPFNQRRQQKQYQHDGALRSEERRAGKESVSRCSSRWSP